MPSPINSHNSLASRHGLSNASIRARSSWGAMLNKQPTPMSKPSSSTPRKDTNKNRAKKSNGRQKADSLTLNPNAEARNSTIRAPAAAPRTTPQNAPHTEPKKQNQSQ